MATACILTDSVAQGLVEVPTGNNINFIVEHPSGEFSVELTLDDQSNVVKAGLLRTTRLLSKGELYIPEMTR